MTLKTGTLSDNPPFVWRKTTNEDSNEMRHTIYLSGPITDNNYYMENFAMWEEVFQNRGYSVVNPAKVNAQLPTDTPYEDYMSMAFTMMAMCDCAFFMPGWEDSRGAKREKIIADEYWRCGKYGFYLCTFDDDGEIAFNSAFNANEICNVNGLETYIEAHWPEIKRRIQ